MGGTVLSSYTIPLDSIGADSYVDVEISRQPALVIVGPENGDSAVFSHPTDGFVQSELKVNSVWTNSLVESGVPSGGGGTGETSTGLYWGNLMIGNFASFSDTVKTSAAFEGIYFAPSSNILSIDTPKQISLIPKSSFLYQNYPNPFNPTSTIRFDLIERSTVVLSIFNIIGQRVKEIDLGHLGAVSYKQTIDMSRYASGIYFYRIQAGNFIETKKMMLLK
jgi:hypothetical protein